MRRRILFLNRSGTKGCIQKGTASRTNEQFRSTAVFILFLSFLVPTAAKGQGVPYKLGDVFVSVSNGQVQHRDSAGNLLETLNTLQGGFTTGMAFDSAGNLYVTDFSAGTVSRFDSKGALIGTFGSGYSG